MTGCCNPGSQQIVGNSEQQTDFHGDVCKLFKVTHSLVSLLLAFFRFRPTVSAPCPRKSSKGRHQQDPHGPDDDDDDGDDADDADGALLDSQSIFFFQFAFAIPLPTAFFYAALPAFLCVRHSSLAQNPITTTPIGSWCCRFRMCAYCSAAIIIPSRHFSLFLSYRFGTLAS